LQTPKDKIKTLQSFFILLLSVFENSLGDPHKGKESEHFMLYSPREEV
jgi:hypothetical protein